MRSQLYTQPSQRLRFAICLHKMRCYNIIYGCLHLRPPVSTLYRDVGTQ